MITGLDERLRAALRSERFAQAGQAGAGREHQLTNNLTQAALCEIVRLLSPARVLEIGTYFADTAHQMAQVMAEEGSGHLTTIDPFGGARIPPIIAGWPEALRQYVTFHAQNSMSFFLDLESARTGTGKDAPFDVVFVDGHHSFEYAFFDLMRAMLYLRPGGVIVVDNVEQAGPCEALRLFCASYAHWRLFSLDGGHPRADCPEFVRSSGGAILLAPAGIEIGAVPFKFTLFDIGLLSVRELTLNTLQDASSGRLIATVNLYSFPPDIGVAGTGAVSSVRTAEYVLRGAGAGDIVIHFDPPLNITALAPDCPVSVDIELRYLTEPPAPQLLLDPNRPVAVT